jgi:hypothetical protein
MRGAKLLQEYAEIGTVRMRGKEIYIYRYIIIVLDCVVQRLGIQCTNFASTHMYGPACCLPACLPAALIESIVLQLLHAGREEFPQASVATPT